MVIRTYAIKQTYPNLEFDEMLVGAGGKCGSTYIDREFHKWMSSEFGRAFDNDVKFEKKGPGSKFMKEFESAKRDFGRSCDHDQEFECSLHIPGARDSQYYEADESLVKISKSVFLFGLISDITNSQPVRMDMLSEVDFDSNTVSCINFLI